MCAGVGHVMLRGLTDAVGHTANERYNILDNRDKILRQGRLRWRLHRVTDNAITKEMNYMNRS